MYDFRGATLDLIYKQPPASNYCDHNVGLAWGVPVPGYAEDYEKPFGHPLYTVYRCVEARILNPQKCVLHRGSCGTVNTGYQLRIANKADKPIAPGTVGHMLLRSGFPTAFFQGYLFPMTRKPVK